jgi:uncharacterized protein (TIGR00369 family)
MTATVFDRFPRPACAELLGWRLLDHDAARGWARIGFEGRREFLNPAGFIQGGMLAAMLDDAMGPPVLLKSNGTLFTVTIDMQVSYLAPARPGPFVGEGQILQLGKTIAFLEARLMDGEGTIVARATSSARLVPVGRLQAAPAAA